MAEYQTVLRDYKRMCDMHTCSTCPLGKTYTLWNDICSRWVIAYPEKAEHTIMEWARKNPFMTNRMRFEEVFGCGIVTHEIHEAIPGHVEILNASDEEFEEWLNAEYKGER